MAPPRTRTPSGGNTGNHGNNGNDGNPANPRRGDDDGNDGGGGSRPRTGSGSTGTVSQLHASTRQSLDQGRPGGRSNTQSSSSNGSDTTGRGTPGDTSGRPGDRREPGNDTRDDARPDATKPTGGDPIDLATGEVLLRQTDLELAGALPLALKRTYRSNYRDGGWFGTGWASTLDQRLELTATGVFFMDHYGTILKYPQMDLPRVQVLPVEGARRPLALTGDGGYILTDPRTGITLHFPAPGDQHGWSTLPLTAITDRNGNRIDILYQGQVPIEIRHSGGYRIAVDTTTVTGAGTSRPTMGLPDQHMPGAGAFEAGWTGLAGRITGLRLLTGDAPGDSVTVKTFAYSEHGRLAQVTNSSGIPQRFAYDDAGRMTGWQDRNGHSYTYTYDTHGRAVRGTGSGGILNTTISYEDDRVTRMTDALGHTTVYEFNELKQLVAIIDPLGNTTRSEWDRYDRLLSRTDPLGQTTRFAYDEAGNLTTVALPNGSQSTATYSDLNLPVEVTDVAGRTWRYAYDDRGNFIEVTDPIGAVTRYEHNERGNLTAISDALGHRTRITCDEAGLPAQITDPLGGTTRIVRDPFGRPIEVHDPVGGIERYAWTVEGKRTQVVLPSGAVEMWDYDGEGNQTRHVDASGLVTITEYGPLDLPVSRTEPDGATLRFGYDGQMRLTQVINPQGLVWRYEYDPAGNLVSETDFNGRTLTYTHDAAGRLTSRTNGLGQTITYTRDPLGRVIEKHADGQVTTYTYTANGRLVHARTPDADLRLDYDPLGRVTAETCNGRTLTSAYDALGQRVHRRTPSGAESIWSYDPAGRPLTLTAGGQTVAFTHDAAGRETQRSLGHSVAVTQTWTPDHRLLAQTLWSLTTQTTVGAGAVGQSADPMRMAGEPVLLQHRTYTYRPNGDITAIGDRLTGDRRYDLDPAGRVTTVHARGWTERYAYDIAGNLIHATWPADGSAAQDIGTGADAIGDREYAGARITRAGGIRYEHDAQGRMVLRQQARPSSKPLTWRYHWNAEDRLTAVQTPDGQWWRYTYDPFGRRITKQCLSTDGTSIIEQTDFIWDENVLIEQLQHTWQPASREWSYKGTTWDYQPGSHRPVTQTERAPARDASQQWFDQQFYAIVTDLTGTPTELIDTVGDLAWHSGTTLWGTNRHINPQSAYCPLRFPGQYHDAETGLNYNHHRYYDPAIGRYISDDPLGFTAGPNSYAYVINPTLWVDPLGLSSDPVIPIYRKQTSHPLSQRLTVDSDGNVTLTGKGKLYINASGDIKHTVDFRSGTGGEIIKFDVPASYVDSLRATAIPQEQPDWWTGTKEEYDQLRKICPEISDPTKGDDLYGIPRSMLDDLRNNIVPGSGKRLNPDGRSCT